jgi:anti-sigma factor ChrR (cupin superfamily)
MSEQINGNLSLRVSVDTSRMEWMASPSGTVMRKRVHLVGPPESGQVTSVVRYEPGATFPSHGHPEGEEILVLDGVFSDEHGDWPAGTYLLNPEGFHHAPFSEPGCLLLVKLRQFPGSERNHVVVDTTAEPWIDTEIPGFQRKPLYQQDGFSDQMWLERWDAQTKLAERRYPDGAELFVIEGSYQDELGSYAEGGWQRLPVGSSHVPRTDSGCTLYLKTGGFAYMRAAD